MEARRQQQVVAVVVVGVRAVELELAAAGVVLAGQALPQVVTRLPEKLKPAQRVQAAKPVLGQAAVVAEARVVVREVELPLKAKALQVVQEAVVAAPGLSAWVVAEAGRAAEALAVLSCLLVSMV